METDIVLTISIIIVALACIINSLYIIAIMRRLK